MPDARRVIVEIQDIARLYGTGTPAIEGVSLTLREGDFVSLVGPSGCGKSTLLNIIGLLDHATKGSVAAFGEHIDSTNYRQQERMRRDHVGFLFQDSGLIARMTVEASVALPLRYRNSEERDIRVAVASVLELLGLASKAKTKTDVLSGGERQRVGLARALVTKPALLLCDEPTAALDDENSRFITQHLREMTATGTCVVCASHDPILFQSTKQIVLNRGKVVRCDI